MLYKDLFCIVMTMHSIEHLYGDYLASDAFPINRTLISSFPFQNVQVPEPVCRSLPDSVVYTRNR